MGARTLLRRIAAAAAVAALAGFVSMSLPFSPVRAVVVSGTSMEPTLDSGDLVLAVRRSEYRSGDVVVFRVPAGAAGAGKLVVHRIVGGGGRTGYWMRGDNREGREPWRPRSADVVGRTALHVPRLGMVPAYLRTPAGFALLAAFAKFATFIGTGRRSATA